MTAFAKNRLAWACIMITGLALGGAALYLSTWFIVPFFANVFTGHIWLNRITCPNCATPLTYEGRSLLARMAPPSAWSRKECAACGWDLRRNP